MIPSASEKTKPSSFVPQWFLFSKGVVQKPALRHVKKIATIRLQRNPKAKMMQADFFAFLIFVSIERPPPATTKGL
jgi:hypothetical protein